ncbi:MAG: adenylosuccinate synthetase, partial [Planctomycetota bacterium]
AVRYSAMLSGCTRLSIMLLDVLAGFDELRICTGYRLPESVAQRIHLPCEHEKHAAAATATGSGADAALNLTATGSIVTTDRFIPDAWALEHVEPIYETLPGFSAEITEARTFEDLPPAARDYLDCIAEVVGLPISVVSVGPDRAQTLRKDV